METLSNHFEYHQQIPSIFGAPLSALVVAGLVGLEAPSVVAWMDLGGVAGQNLEPLRFALDMERSYADAYCGFFEAEHAPRYQLQRDINLCRLAGLFGVDRVLCVVAITDRHEVVGGRDYGDVDLALVTDVVRELGRLARHAGGGAQSVATGGRLN